MAEVANSRPEGQGQGLVCPACRVDLVMSERQGIEIDYCPKCRGVWLDRGELDKIIERSASEEIGAAPVQSSGSRPAPQAQPYPPQGYYEDRHGQGGHRGRHGGHGGRHGSFLGRLFD